MANRSLADLINRALNPSSSANSGYAGRTDIIRYGGQTYIYHPANELTGLKSIFQVGQGSTYEKHVTIHGDGSVPSTQTTFTAPLPNGYHGACGPTLRALVLALGHGANVSQPALRTFLRDVGMQIGTGTLARMLLDHDGQWTDEAAAIHQVGLASGTWVASDQTSPRVDGQNEVCHVVGNTLFTSYHTRPAARVKMCWRCSGGRSRSSA